MSDLGGNTFAINGIPAGLEGLNPVTLLQSLFINTVPELVEGLTSHLSPLTSHLSPLTSHLAMRLAQSAAIPYGQVLSSDEMESVINALFSCSNVNYTPDGKAILCILPQADIEQLLG